jgi:PIN domain-containing protein
MRILVDENVPVQMLETLRWLLPAHEVRHVSEIKWAGKKDLALLPDAAKKGFDAFLTRDARQLEDPSETDAIKKSRMHHIRFGQGQRGMAGLGLAMGAVVAAMPLIVGELDEADSQRLVHIKGLNPGSKHRYDLVDPTQSPLRYWPR